MDPVTHALAGAAMGRAGLEERYGKGTALELALLSQLPDIDQLVLMWSGDPFYIMKRRMFTHSVVGIPLLCLGAAFLYRRIRPQASLKDHFTLGLVACSVHVFMDLINSFGVCFLYPFTRTRFEFSTVFIIDLAFAMLLALAAFSTSRAWARRFLTSAVAYVAFCFGMHGLAMSQLQGTILDADSYYVFPEALGPHRWRGVVGLGNKRLIYLLEPLSGDAERKEIVETQEGDPVVQKVREHPLAKRLEWFFKRPVWSVERKDGKPVAVTVSDLRFASVVLSWRKGFGCRFDLNPDGSVASAYWGR